MRLTLIELFILISSCTYSVNFIQTDGTATDLVDEVSTPTADVRPTLSIPAPAL